MTKLCKKYFPKSIIYYKFNSVCAGAEYVLHFLPSPGQKITYESEALIFEVQVHLQKVEIKTKVIGLRSRW